MTWGLKRLHQSEQTHFVTFCCYHRRRFFTTDATCRIFESALERVRCSYRLYIYGYVIMPDHVHLLLSEPQRNDAPHNSTGGPLKPAFGLSGNTGNVLWLPSSYPRTLADALKSLKQGVSRRLLGSQRTTAPLKTSAPLNTSVPTQNKCLTQ